MEKITSRKNEFIRYVRRLGTDGGFRREASSFVCDGEKLLAEALAHGAPITAVLWRDAPGMELDCARQYVVPGELLDYVSPLKNSGGVVFTVRSSPWAPAAPGKTLVAETIQDPGNLGTILRTANALNVDTVILTGECADVYHPKTIRAGMGAVFRQRVYEMDRQELRDYLTAHGQRLLGAALTPGARDIRSLSLQNTAVAVGSEGRGLSPQLLALCDGELIIPMNGACESLNAAVAAAIILWELTRGDAEAAGGRRAQSIR